MNVAHEVPVTAMPPQRWANSGGPSSRTRTELVPSELLGKQTGHIQCPRVRRLGLGFGERPPVTFMEGLLRSAGLLRAEQLRTRFVIPTASLLAMPAPANVPRLEVGTAPLDEVLEQALLLGLCTRHVYNPARPVLWTFASLTRGLDLFESAGFYA